MALAEQVLLAAIGVGGTVVGVFGLYLVLSGTHEQLEPPLGWGGRVGIGSFESTRSRRIIWFVYGIVSLLTGLVFLAVWVSTLT